MKNVIFACLICFLGGCVGYRTSHVIGNISGTNVQTPYGPATGNLQYEATTCIGTCPKPMEIINSQYVVTNAANIGSASNTSK